MKKIFTLIAAVMAVASINAQTWKQDSSTAPEAGANLVDNDLATVSTVSTTTAKQQLDDAEKPTTVTIGEYTFGYYIQVRTDDPTPNADNPTGGVQSGSTALVVTAKKDVDVTFYYRRQKGTAGFDKDDNKDMLCWSQNNAKFQSEEEITPITGNDDYAYAKKTYKFVEGGVYTIYRKGSTMNLYGIDVAAGTAAGDDEGGNTAAGTVIISWNEEPTLSSYTDETWANQGKDNNVAQWSNGVSIMIMRSDKGQSAGKEITIDGAKYKTIKVSNFAQNKLILPEGKVTKKMTIYSYVNKDAATDRPCYWAEVAGVTYTGIDEEIFANYGEYETADPDKREYSFEAANTVTFTNTGEQCCYVLVIEVENGGATGITSAATVVTNAPAYNLAGQQVDASYKGVVIKSGQKLIQK